LTELLQMTSADGAVYFRALRPFEPTLVLVQETRPPGRTFALQLRAEPGAGNQPMEVLAPNAGGSTTAATGTPPTPSIEITEASPTPKRLGYVALTRYAAQQVYAPERVLRLLDGVYQSPVPAGRAVPLIRGASVLADVEAVPIGSWSEDSGLYVTAVKLRNRSPRAIELDPRTALRGEWLAATFQHYRILPAGHEADTSAVYLISTRPFSDALGLPQGRR
jgi:integrating conjugative element protein (TIGR03749 family)